jgi:hypothetical protein
MKQRSVDQQTRQGHDGSTRDEHALVFCLRFSMFRISSDDRLIRYFADEVFVHVHRTSDDSNVRRERERHREKIKQDLNNDDDEHEFNSAYSLRLFVIP